MVIQINFPEVLLECPPPHFLATAHRKVLQSAVELEWSSDTIQQPQTLNSAHRDTQHSEEGWWTLDACCVTFKACIHRIKNIFYPEQPFLWPISNISKQYQTPILLLVGCVRDLLQCKDHPLTWCWMRRPDPAKMFSCPLSAANHLCCHSWTRKHVAQSWPSTVAYAHSPFSFLWRERLRSMHSLFMSECFMCTKQTVVTGRAIQLYGNGDPHTWSTCEKKKRGYMILSDPMSV